MYCEFLNQVHFLCYLVSLPLYSHIVAGLGDSIWILQNTCNEKTVDEFMLGNICHHDHASLVYLRLFFNF